MVISLLYEFQYGLLSSSRSTLASNAANRAAFIGSLRNFMDEYGFQGVDIDWEYPGAPERGGERIDTENYVQLIKEMRAAFVRTSSQYIFKTT
jgi:chitinase